MGVKLHFLSFFREFFIYHHRSLEFRAKIFAAILLVKSKICDNDFDELNEIASEIYANDEKRKEVLILTVKEYIKKVYEYKNFDIDMLLKEIDDELKLHHRFVKKIDFSHLRILMSDDENEAILQQRVYEFLVNEVKIYS